MKVTLVEELGADTYVYGDVTTPSGDVVNFVARSRPFESPAIGAEVLVRPNKVYVFDVAGDQIRIS